MFLSTHTTFALALVQLPLPWWLIFALSFASHFLLDFIPHGDENLINKNLNKKQTIKRILIVVFIDIIIVLIILGFFVINHKLNFFIFLTVLLATIPDGFEFLNVLTGKKYKALDKFSQFHHLIHNWPKINYPLAGGIIMQLFLILLLIKIFF